MCHPGYTWLYPYFGPTWVIMLAFQRRFHHEKPRMAEGVGFEPTVGFPTLDFESSALNRTQPPFLLGEKNAERRSNIQHRKQLSSRFGVQRCIQPISWLGPTRLADRILCLTRLKMLQFSACHVCRAYCILYVHTDSHAITCCRPVFTGSWRRCSPVFPAYSETSTPPLPR